jgi:hypothetical protein
MNPCYAHALGFAVLVTPAPSATTSAVVPASVAPAEPAPGPAAAEPQAAPEPTTPIADRLFAPSVAFMLRYEDSSPKQAARATCTKSEEDPDAHSKCMDKERARFLADVLVFRQTDKISSLIIYRRDGNALQEISRSVVELGEKTPDKVAMKVKSDKGSRVLFAGKKELLVQTSSDSSSMIEIDDPRFGKLVYEARIGLVNDPS